jgi:hypothetical protein
MLLCVESRVILRECWNRILTIFDPYTFSHRLGQIEKFKSRRSAARPRKQTPGRSTPTEVASARCAFGRPGHHRLPRLSATSPTKGTGLTALTLSAMPRKRPRRCSSSCESVSIVDVRLPIVLGGARCSPVTTDAQQSNRPCTGLLFWWCGLT